MRHSLYFVGAGFTKALQHRQPIPMMMDFVNVMCHYARHDDVVLMSLIALEAMGCYEHAISELQALAREPKPKRHRVELLRRIQHRPAESIERLLAAAEQAERGLDPITVEGFAAAIYSPVLRAQFAINRMFRRIGWSLSTRSLVRYLRMRYALPDHRQTFVSFNYDLVLEHSLEEAINWSPKNGYGLNLRWAAVEDPDEVPGPDLRRLRRSGDEAITVLKPHGSLNWLLATRGHFRLPFVAVTAEERVRYIGTRVDHPYVSLPDRFPTPVAPFIVPPTSHKNTDLPLLRQVRASELAAVESADEVFILGWSLPETDVDQENLIRRAVAHRTSPFRRVVVVNFKAVKSFYSRIATIFGVQRPEIEIYDNGLEEFLARENRAG